ncbi:MAG: rubredoxin [Hyphomicrobiales bacterium]|nr:rubredoxin [Hyphomicrobiales bacterium]MCP5373128.1 rubredoxin [Hyphomicrobiales bacterium]
MADRPDRPWTRRAVVAGLAAAASFATAPGAAPAPPGARRLRKWRCVNQDCEPYVYDPSLGDPNMADEGHPIPPGVAFEDLPDTWICPVCGDPKALFIPLDEWVEVTAQA